MVIVVTGGNGFIGRRLVDKVRKMGNEVTVVERTLGNSGILNKDLLFSVFKDASVIYHLGSVSGNLYFEDPPEGISTNCLGTWNVLEVARQCRVKRVVFVSSQTCYDGTSLPNREDGPVRGDMNVYAATKVFGEWLCSMFWRRYGLETVVLRLASIYGIGEETKGHVANPVTQFLWSMMKGDKPLLYGNGTQTRDLVFVDDVVSALIHSGVSVLPGEIYNVSTFKETSFNGVVHIINKILGTNITPLYGPYVPTGMQSDYIARQITDNSKLVGTGWKPVMSVEEGLAICHAYYSKLVIP